MLAESWLYDSPKFSNPILGDFQIGEIWLAGEGKLAGEIWHVVLREVDDSLLTVGEVAKSAIDQIFDFLAEFGSSELPADLFELMAVFVLLLFDKLICKGRLVCLLSLNDQLADDESWWELVFNSDSLREVGELGRAYVGSDCDETLEREVAEVKRSALLLRLEGLGMLVSIRRPSVGSDPPKWWPSWEGSETII